MSTNEQHPIIAKGELYVTAIEKNIYPGKINYPHEYEEAKARLLEDVTSIQRKIEEASEVFVGKKILCVRLEPKFEAKSYAPSSLIAETSMRLVGGRKYAIDSNGQKGKLYFMRADDEGIEKLKDKLSTSQKDQVKSWRNQLCTIKSIDLLNPEEKIMGFSDEWSEGSVEVVIHPLGEDSTSAIQGFFEIAGIQEDKAMVRSYDDGLTFVCAHMDKESMERAKKYNPLRSIKPMGDEWFDPLRGSAMVAPAPKAPENPVRSSVKVGVFDGGIQEDAPLLTPFVTNYDMVDAEATIDGLDHGSGICGAILYGNLFGKTSADVVDMPDVSVESFRVFPAKKTGNAEMDWQMYTTIDIIEEVVKGRPDIKLFNLSVGPRGAILDDEINRFTYVCDKLTYDVDEEEVNPLFCVAVGNDGELEDGLNRIQSPSDMVNGLAVGAYTYSPLNDKYRAMYSCVGPGREGAKIKPDILEFGGEVDRPFIAVKTGNQIEGVRGTSYASPVATGKIGRLMAKSSQIVPHLGRALLIHNAEAEDLKGNYENGFGYCPQDVLQVLNCTDTSVTILYEGEITSSTSVKLPVFLPEVNDLKGMANIRWTICTVVNPNLNDPDAYTNNCIEDTFYPHEMKFTFRKEGEKDVRLNLLDADALETANALVRQGYSCSALPISKPAKKNYAEADLRNLDFKWDTIIRKNVVMQCKSLLNPFITLHAIGRDEYEHEKIRYFVVVTVDVPNYEGSLYDNILQTYNNLAPINIQATNRVVAEV